MSQIYGHSLQFSVNAMPHGLSVRLECTCGRIFGDVPASKATEKEALSKVGAEGLPEAREHISRMRAAAKTLVEKAA